jgi:hypothetical protein
MNKSILTISLAFLALFVFRASVNAGQSYNGPTPADCAAIGQQVGLDYSTCYNQADDYDPPDIICNSYCYTPVCDSGISCGACSAPANTCSANNGTQSCTYTAFSGGGSCSQATAPDQYCTVSNCSAGYQCTNDTCTPICSNSAPSAPSLSGPSDGLTLNATSTSLSWSAPSSWGTNCSGNSNQYQVHFSTSNPPGVLATQASPTNRTVSSLLQGTTYYWDICASNNGFATQSCSAVRSFTVSTLTSDLTANGSQSINQSYPLTVNVSASTGGSATGTMNYTFYCNRADAGTNVTTPYDAKFDATNTNPENVASLCNYTAPGTYYAKVIVERGPWATQDQVVITLSNTPPVVSSPVVDPPSAATYCGAASQHFSWTFSDAQDGSVQTAYQLQVSTSSLFSSLAYDSGQFTSSSTSLYVPVSVSPAANQLAFNTSYFWRIRVYDSANASSPWVNGSSFTTPRHPYPQPSFTWTPLSPDVGDTVSFADHTIFSALATSKSWLWTIPNASYVDGTNSTTENPHVQFTNTNTSTVILQASDDVGTCSTPSTPITSGSGQNTITPRPPLPQFKEVQP